MKYSAELINDFVKPLAEKLCKQTTEELCKQKNFFIDEKNISHETFLNLR
jgi:hypothetical protein